VSLRRFILETVDPETECIVRDVSFETECVEELRAIVDAEATEEDFVHGFDLDQEEVNEICKRFRIRFDSGTFPVSLRSSQWFDQLPYKLHTNRELSMMLSGRKPFAYFADSYPANADFRLPEHLFDRYVEAGLFVKREYILLNPHQREVENRWGTRVVLYAQKHEEWRMEAFAVLLKYGNESRLE
jgi:hypothetical protein